MCGLSGIYGLNEVQRADMLIRDMNSTMAHRGPNDEGYFIEDKIALGHRRLSIIDLSSAGHQPMRSLDGRYTIVFNGEIYNYLEVKNEIVSTTEIKFNTGSDTEVLLGAYQAWGKDCLRRLNGMFAFAVWDHAKKELFIARDRLGIKPLYYYQKDALVLFASEIRALLASGIVPRKASQEGVIDFLRYQTVHAPNTILKDVYMLMPGHYMLISSVGVTISKYWSLNDNISKASVGKSYQEVNSDIKGLLLAAVERRLVSDVPFGAFLSGGIDSSAVVGLMSQVANRKVKTFSVVFDESEFSEAKYAKMVADKFQTDHHELKLTPSDFLKELPAGLSAFDHPTADALNTYVVSKYTKEAGITMALSGLGGDELFAGYDIFKRSVKLRNNQFIWNLPLSLRKAGGQLLMKMKPTVSAEKIHQLLSLSTGDFSSVYPVSRQFLTDALISKMVNRTRMPSNAVAEGLRTTYGIETADIPFLSKVSIAEISTYMQNVLLRDTDQMSMAHALEVRVPFLDYTLVEYVLGISDNYKYPTYTKKLLVESLGDMLPPEIVHRPKMGFLFPWNAWLKNELRAFCEEKITTLSKHDFFNGEVLSEYWRAFLNGDQKINWARIWIFVVLSNWLTENNVEIE